MNDVRRVAIVAGNGFTIDFCKHSGIQLDPSNPFEWSFDVPEGSGRRWQDAFPTLDSVLAGQTVTSFAAFEYHLRVSAPFVDSSRLDAEARQFIAFAYSVLQEQFVDGCRATWRWRDWLATYRSELELAASFNYDLLLEDVLRDVCILPFRFGVQGESHKPVILKPHGSIDFASDSRAIRVGPQVYPMRLVMSLNDTPVIALLRNMLRAPRQEAFVVLPAEYSPYQTYQWVAPSYGAWRCRARVLTHCVFVGLSDWDCDQGEINTILGALGPKTTVVVANPDPPDTFVRRVVSSGRPLEVWKNGPQALS